MAGKAAFGVAAVRAAAKKRAEETSLHSTADEIGMSYTGLRGFLSGGKPHPRTRELLVSWFARSRSKSQGVAREDLEAALDVVAQYVRDGASDERCHERLADMIERLEKRGVPASK